MRIRVMTWSYSVTLYQHKATIISVERLVV